jgi:PAS domain S-box-containing protein
MKSVRESSDSERLQKKIKQLTDELNNLREEYSLKNEEWNLIANELEIYKAQLEDIVNTRTSELLRSKEKLKLSESRLKSFTEITTDGISCITLSSPMKINLPLKKQLEYIYNNGIFSEVNKAFLQIWGHKFSDKIVGQPISYFFRQHDIPDNIRVAVQFIKNGYQLTNFDSVIITNEKTMHIQNNIIGIVIDNKLSSIWYSIREITEQKKANEAFIYKTKLEQLVSRISSGFINLPFDKIDHHIESSIGEICQLTQSDAGFLALFSPPKETVSLSYVWHNDKIWINQPAFYGIFHIKVQWLTDHLKDKEELTITANEFISQASEKHLLKKYIKGFKKVKLRGVFLKGDILGFIGLLSCDDKFEWKDYDSTLLKVAGDIFINVIQRKEAEKALIQSEDRFRSILQYLSDFILILDKDFRIQYYSPSALKVLGYEQENLIGKNAVDFIHPEDLPQIRKDLEEVLLKMNDYIPSEFRARHQNGHYIFLEAIANNMLDHKAINGIIVTCRDITERKKTENQLIESEEKYRNLFETAHDAIFMMTDDLFIDCNTATLKMFNCTREQIIGKPPYDFSPKYQPDGKLSREKALEKITLAYNGIPQYFEWQHSRLDGSVFDTEVSLNRIELAGNIYLHAIVRDITTRKAAENAIRESEARFRNIFDNSSDAIVIMDENFRFRLINSIAIKKIGYSREELMQMSPTEIISEKYKSRTIERIGKILKGQEVAPIEMEFITKQNTTIPVEINSKLIDYEGSKAVLSVIRDITERKQFEKKIIDTIIITEEKERENFAKNLHDEIGPLLSSMKMYINSLQSNPGKEKHDFIIMQLQDILKEVIQSTKEISNALNPQILSVYGLNAAIESFINHISQIYSINFETNLENYRFHELIEISIYRIVKELINNTMKHSGGKTIFISLNYCDEMLELIYTDDGRGLPAEFVNNIEPHGMGISNIISRIQSLSGTYLFNNLPEKGMRFECKVPVSNNGFENRHFFIAH